MKSIRRKDFLEVGSVVRVHGTRGEIKCICSRGFRLKEWAFLEYQGKPVPFYIEWSREAMEDELILKLKQIDNPEQAEAFLGRVLLLPRKQVQQSNNNDISDEIIGFSVIDEVHGNLGLIHAVHNQTMQVLIEVKPTERAAVLIPWVEEFIVEVDEEEEIIYTRIPEELLHINE